MAQLTLDQLRRFGLTPDTNLGQHFLVDDNVLRVIGRMAGLTPEDVCYEPGIGVGVLTDFLARRVSHVHGVELDRRLEPAISAMQADLDNVTVHWADALELDPATLTPPPTKLVSNLPYHVAAPIVAEALQHAPSLRSYCVMVQREVGERFFAPEGTKGYNALSALVRTCGVRTSTHKVSRQVFAPPPNVDSLLVAFERTDELLEPELVPAYARFLKHAFQHRRKTLANNLQTSGVALRGATVAALARVDLGAAARPEQLSPERFVAVFRELTVDGAATVLVEDGGVIATGDIDVVDVDGTLRATVAAPAKLNLLLAVGAPRGDGFHELVTVMQTLDLADRVDIDVEPWDSDVVDVLVEAPGVPGGDTLVTRAVTELLQRAGRGARVWVTIEKEVPIGGGLGGGSSDAAAALRGVHALVGARLPDSELLDIAAGIGSDVPFFLLGPGRAAVARGRGELLEPLEEAPLPRAWLLAFPNVLQSTAAVYDAFDPSGCDPLPATTADAVRLARSTTRSRNDLAAAARAACPEVDRLVRAFADAGGTPLVCGSGATVAVPVRSAADRRAFEGVATTAVPGCWLRQAWTTVTDADDPPTRSALHARRR